MGYTIGQAGIAMGLWGLGAVVGAFFGGKVTDRIGFYPVQLITLLGGGVLFIALGYMKTYFSICVFTFLLSMVNEAFRPANSTAIATYSKEENRTRSYSLNRLAINLGWAVGSAIGGLLASINYHLLFWVDGCTNIVAALLLWYFLRPSKNEKAKQQKVAGDPQHSAYRDKGYIIFIIFVIFFACAFFQLFSNLPAFYHNERHFSERFIGLLGSINGIMIVVIEMVMVFSLEGKRKSTWFIMWGVILCGLAYLLLDLFPVTESLAIVVIIIMTFGEMVCLPFMNSYWVSRSGPHNRGEYAALYTIAWSVAQTVGPTLGAQVAQYAGFPKLWAIVPGICFGTAIGFGLMNRRAPSQPPTMREESQAA